MQVPVARCPVAVPFKNHAYFDQIRKLLDGSPHIGGVCQAQKCLMGRLDATSARGVGVVDSGVHGGFRRALPAKSVAHCAARIACWAQSHVIRVESQTLTFR